MKNLIVRLTEEQEKTLRYLVISEGFKTKSEYVRSKIFENVSFKKSTFSNTEDNEFEMQRSERRSFFCPNKLWFELQKLAGDDVSISHYIRSAIEEKVKRK